MQFAGFLAALWCLSLVSYLLSPMMHIPMFSHPLSLVVFCLIYLFNPFRVLHFKARWWLLRVLVSACCSGFLLPVILCCDSSNDDDDVDMWLTS